MGISKDTTLCISIAERPGDFGATIHNTAYEYLGLNFIYMPFEVKASELQDVIKAVRTLKIRGCGVSMPHKIEIIKYLDEIEESAEKIGAVNTIVNTEGVLKGYNTDYYGVKAALEKHFNPKGKEVLMIGAGGVARAIAVAVNELEPSEFYIANRTHENAESLAKEFNLKPVKMDELPKVDLLINATPNENIVEDLDNYNTVLDMMVSDTKLIENARKRGLVTIPGYVPALYQAVRQFELYTNREAPVDEMKKSIGVKNR